MSRRLLCGAIGLFLLASLSSAQDAEHPRPNILPGKDWVPKFEVGFNLGGPSRTWEQPIPSVDHVPDRTLQPRNSIPQTYDDGFAPISPDTFKEELPSRTSDQPEDHTPTFGPRPQPEPGIEPVEDRFPSGASDAFGPGEDRVVPDPSVPVQDVVFQSEVRTGLILRCDAIETKAQVSPDGTVVYDATVTGPALLQLNDGTIIRCVDVRAADGRITFQGGRIETEGADIAVADGSFEFIIESIEIRKQGSRPYSPGTITPGPTYNPPYGTTSAPSEEPLPVLPSTLFRLISAEGDGE